MQSKERKECEKEDKRHKFKGSKRPKISILNSKRAGEIRNKLFYNRFYAPVFNYLLSAEKEYFFNTDVYPKYVNYHTWEGNLKHQLLEKGIIQKKEYKEDRRKFCFTFNPGRFMDELRKEFNLFMNQEILPTLSNQLAELKKFEENEQKVKHINKKGNDFLYVKKKMSKDKEKLRDFLMCLDILDQPFIEDNLQEYEDKLVNRYKSYSQIYEEYKKLEAQLEEVYSIKNIRFFSFGLERVMSEETLRECPSFYELFNKLVLEFSRLYPQLNKKRLSASDYACCKICCIYDNFILHNPKNDGEAIRREIDKEFPKKKNEQNPKDI